MKTVYTFFTSKVEKYLRIDAHYFIKGGFWLSTGQAATILFGLLTTMLFAHYLSEADYGIYRYLISIAAILSSFSLTGLGQSILQTAAKKYYGFYQKTLKINFFYNLPVAAMSLVGATYYWFNENLTLSIGCIIIALLQPFINTFQVIQPFLQGSRRFKESTVLHIARMIIISVSSIIALLLTKNTLILFTVYLTGYFITNFISHIFFHPKISSVPKEIYGKYLSYAKHTSLRNIVLNVSQRLDTIIVFTQLGAVELAIYSIATVIPEQIKGAFKNLATLLLPKYAAHPDAEQIRKSVPKRSLQLFFILLIITIAYILAAPYIYQLLFPKYTEAILYSQLVALSFPAFILFIPHSILQAQLKEGLLYKLTLYSSFFQIIAVFFGILTFGLIGAIMAKICYRIFFMMTVYYLYKKN